MRSGDLRIAGGIALLVCLSVSTVSPQTPSVNLSRDLIRLGIAAQNLPLDDPTFDARPLFQAAVQYAQNNRIPLLTVDRGNYYFLTSQTAGAYLRLFQVSDLLLDLAGSTIHFRRAFLNGILVANSQRVTLANFQTDFVEPPYTHVELTSVDANGRRLLYRTLPGWIDPSSFSGLTTPSGRPRLWAVVFRNGSIVPGTSRMEVRDPIAGGVLELLPDTAPWTQGPTLSTLRAGDVVVMTQRVGQPPIKALFGDAITFSNVTVYGSSSWAVSLEFTSNSVVDRVRVMPRPGSGLIGSNGDGIHVHHALQNNVVRNSYVTGTLDDALAIDALSVAAVIRQTGPRQIRVRRDVASRFPDGTRLNFVAATADEREGGTLVSQNPPDSIQPVQNGEVDLVFDRDLGVVAEGTEVVFGADGWRGAGSRIEDNTIRDVPFGHGIWVSGNRGITVQRNSIGHTSNAGIGVSHGMMAFPGPPARDLVIQSNAVAGSLGPMASGSGSQNAVAAVIVQSRDDTNAFAQTAPNRNIVIRSNYIADSGRAGMWIGHLDGGLVEDNVLVRWNQHPELPYHGVDSQTRSQLVADARQAMVTRFSANIQAVNNRGQSESTLTGAVSLNAASASLPAGPSTGSIIVQSNVPGLEWSAQSDAGWISLLSGQFGTGTGRVEYSVGANTAARRQGSITIAGVVFTVTQDSAPGR